MVGESEDKANSASNYVEVEAEAEFGKNILNSCLWFLTVIIDRRDDYLTVIAAWVGNS